MSEQINAKLVKQCEEASRAIARTDDDVLQQLKEKLDWCIGSYKNDLNPSGLIEVGKMTVERMKAYKKQNPRKLNKKVIEGLEKVLQA